MKVSLMSVILLVRNVPQAIKFYNESVGMQLIASTDSWADLEASKDVKLTLKQVEGEAFVTTGYSPLLNFQVKDIDSVVQKAIQMGGHLDGPIKYPVHGKIASIRSPDGHMIGLFEPAWGQS